MWPFRKLIKPSERVWFERVGFLGAILVGSMKFLVKEHGLKEEGYATSKFFTGYLLGYTEYLDGIDPRLGGIVRQQLFDSIFGSSEGKELYQRAMGHYLLDDQQTRRGWGSGAVDGERYFLALERQQDATDCTDSMESMFQIGSVDCEQQTR